MRVLVYGDQHYINELASVATLHSSVDSLISLQAVICLLNFDLGIVPQKFAVEVSDTTMLTNGQRHVPKNKKSAMLVHDTFKPKTNLLFFLWL